LGAPAVGTTDAVHVACAGVVFGFPAADRRWRAALRRRFAGFVTDEPATFTITRGACLGPGEKRAGSPFGALVDPAAGRADLPAGLTVREAGGLVRALLPLLVDGLVAHAAVLLDGGSGFLCCGQSGAGKSTLARLAGSRGSDELGAARRVDGSWVVSTLPFWKGRAATARLNGVFLLRHAGTNERRRLSAMEAMPALGRHLLWPVDAPEAAQRTMDLLADLVDRVPIWDLGFRPSAEVLELIAAPAERGAAW
jgi:hypothetical protein